MKERISLTPDMQLLKTVPGVGDILAIVIDTEIGLIERFASAEQLASYAGGTDMSPIFMSASNGAKVIRWRWLQWRAISRKPPFGS